MSNNDSMASAGKLSLHPTLKASLRSLDLDLEEELTRYQNSQTKLPYLNHSFSLTNPENDTELAENLEQNLDPDVAIRESEPADILEGKTVEQEEEVMGVDPITQEYTDTLSHIIESPDQEEDEFNPQTVSKNWLDYLLSPLGIFSLFLLMIGSIMLGLGLKDYLGRTEPTTVEPPVEEIEIEVDENPPIGNGPDLSSPDSPEDPDKKLLPPSLRQP